MMSVQGSPTGIFCPHCAQEIFLSPAVRGGTLHSIRIQAKLGGASLECQACHKQFVYRTETDGTQSAQASPEPGDLS